MKNPLTKSPYAAAGAGALVGAGIAGLRGWSRYKAGDMTGAQYAASIVVQAVVFGGVTALSSMGGQAGGGIGLAAMSLLGLGGMGGRGGVASGLLAGAAGGQGGVVEQVAGAVRPVQGAGRGSGKGGGRAGGQGQGVEAVQQLAEVVQSALDNKKARGVAAKPQPAQSVQASGGEASSDAARLSQGEASTSGGK